MADLKRLNRMVGILSMLDRGEHSTTKGLAEHFGVTARTIFRDLEALGIDFPVYLDETTNSYRFAEGYSLRKINLSTNEIRALLVSKGGGCQTGRRGRECL